MPPSRKPPEGPSPAPSPPPGTPSILGALRDGFGALSDLGAAGNTLVQGISGVQDGVRRVAQEAPTSVGSPPGLPPLQELSPLVRTAVILDGIKDQALAETLPSAVQAASGLSDLLGQIQRIRTLARGNPGSK